MRIIILTAIPLWHPGTSELIEHLRNNGVKVSALDIFHGRAIDDENNTTNLIPFGLKGISARIYMKLFRKSFVRKHTKQADILDIHFVEPAYGKYIPALNKKFICTLFGSDLFRTTPESKEQQRILFDTCDGILLSKNMLEYFEKHFGAKTEKYQFNQYGSARIDSVYAALSTLDKTKTQTKWGIPVGKKVLTIGYNGKSEQQHLKALAELNKLSDEEKSNVFLLFPMTYGGTASYRDDLQRVAENYGFDYKIVADRLSDAELSELRIISDISINTQTTDALASSVKEAFVAGDILLVGEWLPYDIYSDLGVHFLKSNFKDLASDLSNTLQDVEKLQQRCGNNADIIRKFASWNVLIDQWISDYKRLYNESKQ
ncbi:MAG: glycosyltransferase [Crocinitomicaceae bacterium]